MRKVKIVVFTVVGLGLMAGTLFTVAGTRRFVAGARTAPGEVVRLNAGGAHPQVRFVTAEGETVEYPQGGMIWGYRRGDRVTVLYDPRHPSDGPTLDTAGALWGFEATTFLMGAVFVVLAQLAWWRPGWVE